MVQLIAYDLVVWLCCPVKRAPAGLPKADVRGGKVQELHGLAEAIPGGGRPHTAARVCGVVGLAWLPLAVSPVGWWDGAPRPTSLPPSPPRPNTDTPWSPRDSCAVVCALRFGCERVLGLLWWETVTAAVLGFCGHACVVPGRGGHSHPACPCRGEGICILLPGALRCPGSDVHHPCGIE